MLNYFKTNKKILNIKEEDLYNNFIISNLESLKDAANRIYYYKNGIKSSLEIRSLNEDEYETFTNLDKFIKYSTEQELIYSVKHLKAIAIAIYGFREIICNWDFLFKEDRLMELKKAADYEDYKTMENFFETTIQKSTLQK